MSELSEYKQRLKEYLISLYSHAENDKPSMISLVAHIRNELMREIYKAVDDDMI